MYSDEDGELAVRYARALIEYYVKNDGKPDVQLPEHFNEMSGAFVTLNTYPEGDLRGCIGYPVPYFPLKETLEKAAEGAIQDPRFPRLRKRELDLVVVEVSILSPPELINVEKPLDYLKEIVVGRDGLIVEMGDYKGLLLPQVPVEWKWDVKTYLSQTCLKAGLRPDAWLEPDIQIFKFSGQVFSEKKPKGDITRKDLA